LSGSGIEGKGGADYRPPACAVNSRREKHACYPRIVRIRAHLLLLVTVTVLPVLVFSGAMAFVFWRQQRAAVEQSHMDRVRALSIALDLRQQTTLSGLRAMADSRRLDSGALREFVDEARDVMAAQRMWSAVVLVDREGHRLLDTRPAADGRSPNLISDPAVQAVLRTGQPAISPLVRAPGAEGGYTTSFAVPVSRSGVTRYALIAEVDQAEWLRFMALYPVSADATLTLLDQNGFIVARTLNNARWVGQLPAPLLAQRAKEMPVAAYRSQGLEGQWFYSAHSRSAISGWTMAIGVPSESVESQIRASLLAVGVGGVASAFLALALALLLGRRIADPVAGLAEVGAALARADARVPAPRASGVREVDEVAAALADASALLERRAAERDEALRKERTARAEAEVANRAKDSFLAMLGHELRNPLSAIRAALGLVEVSGNDAESMKRAHVVIGRQVGQLAIVVEEMLDLARMTTGKMLLDRHPTELGELARETLEALRATGRFTRHQVSLTAEPAWVYGDPARLNQIIRNLLENALKYTPEGGRIDVEVAAEGDRALVSVRDNGDGIAPALLERVFDLFVRGDHPGRGQGGGLGIGLTLARRIAALHGGTLQAASEGPGRGSTFTVRLPGIAVPVEEKPPAVAPPSERGPRRVLIVEDNADSRTMLRAMLELWGHEVHEAADGEGGLGLVTAVRPEIALIDVGLPGLDGYEVARQIRARVGGDHVFLVAVTGYGDPDDVRRARTAGFDAHLVKPVDVKALAAILGAAGRRPDPAV
jgi:signal transduction histidine kinase/ActR/RegA family two-component response regulator